MDFKDLYQIEDEIERIQKTYEIFNEDTRLNRSKAARVVFLTNVRYIEKYLTGSSKILDIGAGAGEYSIYFARKGYEVSAIELSENNEINAARLRNWLGLAESGPVCQLVSNLENKGILVCLLDVQESGFSGINGTVENYPYIALNSNMTSERQRFTLAHELTHMAFSGE